MPRSLVLALSLLAPIAFAQINQTPNLTGHWTASGESFGTRTSFAFDLEQKGDKLTGKFAGDPVDGSTDGRVFQFFAKDTQGGGEQVKGTIVNGELHGDVVQTDGGMPYKSDHYSFVAITRPSRSTAPPQRHEFAPTVFYRQFSPHNKPVLTVNPGDTIHTTTVDAGGYDSQGEHRVVGGNPQTGPFFIRSAMPGDTLVVHITRLRLNRDWAQSDDFIVTRALDNDLAVKTKDAGKTIIWHLDVAKGTASPDKPSEHLAHYTVPLKPMLGCIATAVGPAQAPPPTGDSGYFGGNMDFNEIVEGATVYLPVANPGALLYLGDAHAAQGDGELNGNALETSMDVEFTVDIIPGKRINGPRVENSTTIMSMGLGSLDDAFKQATSSMVTWLADDYKLTPSEAAQVLGTSAQYKISEAADRNAGVVLKLDKARLQTISPGTK